MQVYFSHRYRDNRINTYFFEQMVEYGFELFADQKTPIWCVAKLERYLQELSGFLSVIPRSDPGGEVVGYSPYIGHELKLARRSAKPRLLFVDDELLRSTPQGFPRDAIPFVYDSPQSDGFRHRQAIANFKEQLIAGQSTMGRTYDDRTATVIAAGRKLILRAAREGMDLLVHNTYRPILFYEKEIPSIFDDPDLFDNLNRSELCVFFLDAHVGQADIALGMAHARSIPSIRLQYDSDATGSEPAVSGLIPWSKTSDLAVALESQLTSFRKGFVQAVQLARDTGVHEAVRQIGTTEWTAGPDQLWNPNDGPSLRKHIDPSHPFIDAVISHVKNQLGKPLTAEFNRTWSHDICYRIYSEIKGQDFGYEEEPKLLVVGQQKIRTVGQILNDKGATCIDLACLFASLLTAAGQMPVIVVLENTTFAHALVGYKAPFGVTRDLPDLGDLRLAVSMEDVVLFEATGAVASEKRVGAETEEERQSGAKKLDFLIAKKAAARMINLDIRLRYAMDVLPS